MNDDANPFETGHHAGREKYRTGKDTMNPYASESDNANIWALGYHDGFSGAEVCDKADDYDDDSHD